MTPSQLSFIALLSAPACAPACAATDLDPVASRTDDPCAVAGLHAGELVCVGGELHACAADLASPSRALLAPIACPGLCGAAPAYPNAADLPSYLDDPTGERPRFDERFLASDAVPSPLAALPGQVVRGWTPWLDGAQGGGLRHLAVDGDAHQVLSIASGAARFGIARRYGDELGGRMLVVSYRLEGRGVARLAVSDDTTMLRDGGVDLDDALTAGGREPSCADGALPCLVLEDGAPRLDGWRTTTAIVPAGATTVWLWLEATDGQPTGARLSLASLQLLAPAPGLGRFASELLQAHPRGLEPGDVARLATARAAICRSPGRAASNPPRELGGDGLGGWLRWYDGNQAGFGAGNAAQVSEHVGADGRRGLELDVSHGSFGIYRGLGADVGDRVLEVDYDFAGDAADGWFQLLPDSGQVNELAGCPASESCPDKAIDLFRVEASGDRFVDASAPVAACGAAHALFVGSANRACLLHEARPGAAGTLRLMLPPGTRSLAIKVGSQRHAATLRLGHITIR